MLILATTLTKGQECSPYHKIPYIKHTSTKSAGLGYVSCFHARGVVAEVGYDNVFVGVLAMGQGHHGATYGFVQYDVQLGRWRVYGGPAYRLNHDPSLIIGRAGGDYRIYKYVYGSASVLQVNPNLNYLHIGLKLIY